MGGERSDGDPVTRFPQKKLCTDISEFIASVRKTLTLWRPRRRRLERKQRPALQRLDEDGGGYNEPNRDRSPNNGAARGARRGAPARATALDPTLMRAWAVVHGIATLAIEGRLDPRGRKHDQKLLATVRVALGMQVDAYRRESGG